ncbi:MAG: leucine-rich repeat domain-containing protein, partial [Ureaplasma sp.]|nr:leucine-rich repeat domain-containing protein [Ureaplasma sp.]
NLKVNAQTIDPNWIESISFVNNDDNQQLEVTLNNYYIRYELNQTNNVKFENNKLIISKMQYYTAVQIENVRLNNLKQNIQSFIQNSPEKLTVEDFKNQLNSNLFRTKIAEYLSISINSIGNITYDNNILKIMPNSMCKFTCDQENLLIVDDYIKLENFDFYQAYELTNLDELYTAINNYIALETNKFTENEFANNVSSTTNNIKQVIANSLQLTDSTGNQNIDISYIDNVQFINNQLEITLSTNYLKYEKTSTNNVEFEDNKLIVKNLNFCELIYVNLDDLINLRTQIIDLINEEKVIENNIDNYLSNQIFDLIKEINTTDNHKLSEFVSTPTFANKTINIPLKNNIGLLKFASISNSNIQVIENNILLKNINLYAPPEPSPTSWFTWSGTQITGLSSLGAQQENIVLPEITTSLSPNAIFYGNKVMKTMDMSFTKITALPETNGSGMFQNSIIESVILPNNLVDMGSRTFYQAKKIKSLKIPESVTRMDGDLLFCEAIELSQINIPKNLKGKFGWRTFSNTKIKNIIIPDGITEIGIECFYNCIELVDIKLPNNLKIIKKEAFDNCTKLQEIKIPDSVTTIETNVFIRTNSNLVVIVSSNNIENLVRTSGFSGQIINLSKPYRND